MCTSESKINKKFTITTQDPTASHRISHLSYTRVPSSFSKIVIMTINMKTHRRVQLTDNKEKRSDKSNQNLGTFFDKEQALAPNNGASQQLAEMDQALLAQNTP